jgi:hypothetical protein
MAAECGCPESFRLARRSEPQVQSDSPKVRLMMDTLDRDYVDVTFSKAPVHARRVLTSRMRAAAYGGPDGDIHT